jgi:hypothetical protein
VVKNHSVLQQEGGSMNDLMMLRRQETARNMKMTVLHRPNGVWHTQEVTRLVYGLRTEASQHPQHPEHIVLWGHHTKGEILKAIGGGVTFTVTQITGMDSKELPFSPEFM